MILQVKVKPGAGKDRVKGFKNGILEVEVKAKPEAGKANESLIRFLSKLFKLDKEDIKIVKGKTSRLKTLKLNGKEDELKRILEEL